MRHRNFLPDVDENAFDAIGRANLRKDAKPAKITFGTPEARRLAEQTAAERIERSKQDGNG